MACAVQTSFEASEVALPDDLRDWMDRYSLARLVLEAIQAATLPSAPATAMRGGNAGIRPHMLLSLLTYCYATGVHGSADIELISTQDPMVRHLCADIYPEAQVLRQFRRRNREAIRTCLAEVLRRAWAIQLSPGAGNPDELPVAIVPDDQFNAPALHAFAAEAEQRINRAVRLDCWTFDD
ncbi:MAG: hypothetical protein E6L09_07680 [Verrucomicrobia bacterium]|nr:MAG: hypothetical protein E6L09_07680 [Verrucomicrobiota bacterium]